MDVLEADTVIESVATQLVVLPKSDLEAIYEFIIALPAKDVLEVLKHFSQVKLAEEK
jgi:hypothetical protein